MKYDIRLFFTALMFYTRIPCPKWVDHSAEYLDQCTKYFPLIGWLMGAATAGVLWLGMIIFPVSISVVLSMIAGILFTGAFHEDGFADVCDGFGGGWTKANILEIMKDSLIGAYGVVGLVLILLLKYAALTFIAGELSVWFLFWTIISAHTMSRIAAVTMIYYGNYAREDASSKVRPVAKKLSPGNFLVALFIGLAPLAAFNNFWYLLSVIPVGITVVWLWRYYKKWIGGYTGDCLGATQQVAEVVVYLSIIVLWKFI
ncbi:Cobalamin synthase [Fulvivirga imtechensis AK7]|uniref:Adenosylcobinamide-GDP ribazoletransferase n=1 Tax=Fulvivirga imtechensis AK7 TaxID=1237149 RepID=L8JMH2_9BACT|nr:adenosylcobinamide-GDP ribazoletransferase [Fulvivirga imtechensis]ELR70116.1 Cobalamin synthase [Fulvivirga imtechensis AK7]